MDKRLQDGYQLGFINYNGIGKMYLMPVAYWILNYKKFDPEYDPIKWDYVFRNHIYNVTDDIVIQYMETIEEHIIDIHELKGLDLYGEKISFVIYIDFDSKFLVNWYLYTEIEAYLPSEQWTGLYGDPKEYLPQRLKDD